MGGNHWNGGGLNGGGGGFSEMHNLVWLSDQNDLKIQNYHQSKVISPDFLLCFCRSQRFQVHSFSCGSQASWHVASQVVLMLWDPQPNVPIFVTASQDFTCDQQPNHTHTNKHTHTPPRTHISGLNPSLQSIRCPILIPANIGLLWTFKDVKDPSPQFNHKGLICSLFVFSPAISH